MNRKIIRVIAAIAAYIMLTTTAVAYAQSADEISEDEAAYVDAFGDIRSRDSNSLFASLEQGALLETSDISFAFFDIDGNGTNELIFSDYDKHGAIIYTLFDGKCVELVHFRGDDDRYEGISEHGYICGESVFSVESGIMHYYEIATDEGRAVDLSAYYNYNINGSKYFPVSEFNIYTPEGIRSVNETDFNHYVDSMTATYVELEWTPVKELLVKGIWLINLRLPQPMKVAVGIDSYRLVVYKGK